jgi:hypothetical protein|nr:MAG TPA: hypothetical protein [Caudoviricetes sp.]DAP24865.1 MAG TPA: hypothetical protein [Bacteriophage sp.]
MIVLHREVFMEPIMPISLVYVVVLLSLLYQMIYYVNYYRERNKRLSNVCSVIAVLLMIGVGDAFVNKRFYQQMERVEVIGQFEDFDKVVRKRGYEVVERRGDIVVLEREYE